ncbi:SDR family NAD(P)-dependent oxidoreductase [Sphingobium yanoikuyae]|uniref:Short-chain dehydrogenase/reductase n=1 Tax=Sphingobium yanoikuyae TaxID=13690 RepID=A0A291MXW9_SPHYA|nr:SDR family NAD(P)-dependent oxidoreductase [Sphingobium yanoikuyae]ATI79936.1 short-chain dehydrogenase/reductase [Sphingobium yanoikuyae]
MNKVWFVTGASRGLGRCIVEAALDDGDRVVATARTPDQLEDLVERWGNQILALPLDVTCSDQARATVKEAAAHFGRIDVVVNNAGKADLAAIEDSDETAFRAQVETVFFGLVNVTKAALPVLREQGSGHFVQISSAGDRMATPGLAAYQSAKWAVTGFSSTLAAEIEPLGLKVSILEPGTMRTDMPGGSSMQINDISEPYLPTVGAVAKQLRGSFKTAPNDPARVARLIVEIAHMDRPPVRLLIGEDALEYGQAAAAAVVDGDERWKELSRSINS